MSRESEVITTTKKLDAFINTLLDQYNGMWISFLNKDKYSIHSNYQDAYSYSMSRFPDEGFVVREVTLESPKLSSAIREL